MAAAAAVATSAVTIVDITAGSVVVESVVAFDSSAGLSAAADFSAALKAAPSNVLTATVAAYGPATVPNAEVVAVTLSPTVAPQPLDDTTSPAPVPTQAPTTADNSGTDPPASAPIGGATFSTTPSASHREAVFHAGLLVWCFGCYAWLAQLRLP
eukprot:93499-Prorocentrum_minimum.AAC.1